MPNDVKLQSEAGTHPLDENLRPLKIGDKTAPLELSDTDVRVVGDLKVTGDIIGNITDMLLENLTVTSLTTNFIWSDTLLVQASGDITLDAGGSDLNIAEGGTTMFKFNTNANTFEILSTANVNDIFKIDVDAEGATTISTTDADSAVGHLTVDADGHVQFDGCAVGFDKEITTFAAAAVTSEGNDSTDIDFRLGNKHQLGLTDNIASGNFILAIYQDAAGSRTVHSDGWKAYASDASLADNELASAGTDGEVRWAGGSAPTLSTGARAIDVISIYWDADLQTALAVASLNFS